MFPLPCMLVCSYCYAQTAHETAGAASTRSSLHPLILEEGQTKMQTSGEMRRENAKLYTPFIASLAKQSICPRVEHGLLRFARNDVERGSLRPHPLRGLRRDRLEGPRPPGLGTRVLGHGTRLGPCNGPPCLDFRQPDFPLVTKS